MIGNHLKEISAQMDSAVDAVVELDGQVLLNSQVWEVKACESFLQVVISWSKCLMT